MNIESPVFVRKEEQFYVHHLLIWVPCFAQKLWVLQKNREKVIVGSDIRVVKTFWK